MSLEPWGFSPWSASLTHSFGGLFKLDSEKLIDVIWFPFWVFIFGIDSYTNTRNESEINVMIFSLIFGTLSIDGWTLLGSS